MNERVVDEEGLYILLAIAEPVHERQDLAKAAAVHRERLGQQLFGSPRPHRPTAVKILGVNCAGHSLSHSLAQLLLAVVPLR